MAVPKKLADILAPFKTLPDELKTQFLLEYAARMPEAPGEAEPVEECQTPFAVRVDLDEAGRVRLAFQVPPSAPTVRAFAGMLAEGLGGLTPEEVLAVPPDFYRGSGLETVITPRRLNGLEAALRRIQDQLRKKLGAA